MADQAKRSRWDNIKARLSDGHIRIRYFGSLAICFIGAMMGFMLFRHSTAIQKPDPSQVATAPDLIGRTYDEPADGFQQAIPAYDQLLAEENAARAAQAKRTGDSAVPVIRASVEQEPAVAAFAPVAEEAAPLAVAPPAAVTPLTAATAAQQSEEALERWQQAIAAKRAAMRNQVNLLITSWQPKDHLSLTVRERSERTSWPRLAAGAAPPNAAAGTAASAARTIVKAGDPPAYGVLETAVNTDEPGPITAVIVSGKLKGTRLMGKVEMGQSAQKAGLHFTRANFPGQPHSLAIDAWAIDPETARTALASKVNNHYLMRYGTLLASSFLSGVSDALLRGGQRQRLIASPVGLVVQTDAYSTQQLMLAGAGKIGKQAAASMSHLINRPATITLHAGIGIGILFMADVTLK